MVDEINEKSLSGAQRYYMHSQAHDQAAKKYSISAKSVDPEQAKIHRKLGRFHKTISAVLSQIAGVHTSNDFNRAMKKKAENMANKKVNEENLDEAIVSRYDPHSGEDRGNIIDAAEEGGHKVHSERDAKGHVVIHHTSELGKAVLKSHIKKNFHADVVEETEMNEDLNEADEHSYHVIEMHPTKGHHELSSHGSLADAVEGARHKSGTSGIKGIKRHERFIVHAKNDEVQDTYDSRGNHAPHYKQHIQNEDVNLDEEFVTEHLDMLNALYDHEPGAFSSAFASLMQRKALDRIEELKIDIAQSTFSEDEDIHEDVDQIDELTGKGQLPRLRKQLNRAMDTANDKSAKARADHPEGPFSPPDGIGNRHNRHPAVKKADHERNYIAKKRVQGDALHRAGNALKKRNYGTAKKYLDGAKQWAQRSRNHKNEKID